MRAAEAPLHGKKLSEAVARYLFKLMVYKDEYEVARLHTETGFLDKIAAQFEGDYTVNYHLACRCSRSAMPTASSSSRGSARGCGPASRCSRT